MKCSECGSHNVKTYVFVKCMNCKTVHKDFFIHPKQGWKLKSAYNKEHNEILIEGDRAGLEHLAATCLHIIGNTDPSGHIHYDPQPIGYTLSLGSISTTIAYTEDKKGELDFVATGKAVYPKKGVAGKEAQEDGT